MSPVRRARRPTHPLHRQRQCPGERTALTWLRDRTATELKRYGFRLRYQGCATRSAGGVFATQCTARCLHPAVHRGTWEAPTNNEVAVLVREFCPDKLREISAAEVQQLQMQRIPEPEHSRLHELSELAHQQQHTLTKHTEINAENALHHASDHLFERGTVVKTPRVLK